MQCPSQWKSHSLVCFTVRCQTRMHIIIPVIPNSTRLSHEGNNKQRSDGNQMDTHNLNRRPGVLRRYLSYIMYQNIFEEEDFKTRQHRTESRFEDENKQNKITV